MRVKTSGQKPLIILSCWSCGRTFKVPRGNELFKCKGKGPLYAQFAHKIPLEQRIGKPSVSPNRMKKGMTVLQKPVIRAWTGPCLFTLLALLTMGCEHIPSAPGTGEEARRQRRLRETEIVRDLQSHLQQLADENRFSGAVLLAKDNTILFEQAYGFADPAAKVPNKLNTTFYLASVSKVFTSVAILQLAQAGKLSLDEALIKLLPDYPNKEVAKKITVRQLLTHTSGLGNFFERFVALNFRQYQTPESVLPVFANDPLQFEPGSKHSYSNAGYLLLGLIIEHVAGQSYEDYVREHMFKPAGMTSSGYSASESRAMDAVGGAYSTVGDLLKFSRALRVHKLLNQEYSMLLMNGGGGMQALSIGGIRVAGHIGGAPGMSTSFDIFPDLGYTVVILSTSEGAAVVLRDRVRRELTKSTGHP